MGLRPLSANRALRPCEAEPNRGGLNKGTPEEAVEIQPLKPFPNPLALNPKPLECYQASLSTNQGIARPYTHGPPKLRSEARQPTPSTFISGLGCRVP